MRDLLKVFVIWPEMRWRFVGGKLLCWQFLAWFGWPRYKPIKWGIKCALWPRGDELL